MSADNKIGAKEGFLVVPAVPDVGVPPHASTEKEHYQHCNKGGRSEGGDASPLTPLPAGAGAGGAMGGGRMRVLLLAVVAVTLAMWLALGGGFGGSNGTGNPNHLTMVGPPLPDEGGGGGGGGGEAVGHRTASERDAAAAKGIKSQGAPKSVAKRGKAVDDDEGVPAAASKKKTKSKAMGDGTAGADVRHPCHAHAHALSPRRHTALRRGPSGESRNHAVAGGVAAAAPPSPMIPRALPLCMMPSLYYGRPPAVETWLRRFRGIGWKEVLGEVLLPDEEGGGGTANANANAKKDIISSGADIQKLLARKQREAEADEESSQSQKDAQGEGGDGGGGGHFDGVSASSGRDKPTFASPEQEASYALKLRRLAAHGALPWYLLEFPYTMTYFRPPLMLPSASSSSSREISSIYNKVNHPHGTGGYQTFGAQQREKEKKRHGTEDGGDGGGVVNIFDGSIPLADYFVPYDEAEWSAYCDAASTPHHHHADPSASSSSSSTHSAIPLPYTNNIVVPHKVVYLIGSTISDWEVDAVAKTITPTVFRMDMRRGKGGVEGEGAGGLEALARTMQQQEGRNASSSSSSPIVFTFHLIFDAESFVAPYSTIADLSTTMGCLREHLLLWYDGVIVDSVFFGTDADIRMAKSSLASSSSSSSSTGGDGGDSDGDKSFLRPPTSAVFFSDVKARPDSVITFLDTFESVRMGDWVAVGDARAEASYRRVVRSERRKASEARDEAAEAEAQRARQQQKEKKKRDADGKGKDSDSDGAPPTTVAAAAAPTASAEDDDPSSSVNLFKLPIDSRGKGFLTLPDKKKSASNTNKKKKKNKKGSKKASAHPRSNFLHLLSSSAFAELQQHSKDSKRDGDDGGDHEAALGAALDAEDARIERDNKAFFAQLSRLKRKSRVVPSDVPPRASSRYYYDKPPLLLQASMDAAGKRKASSAADGEDQASGGGGGAVVSALSSSSSPSSASPLSPSARILAPPITSYLAEMRFVVSTADEFAARYDTAGALLGWRNATRRLMLLPSPTPSSMASSSGSGEADASSSRLLSNEGGEDERRAESPPATASSSTATMATATTTDIPTHRLRSYLRHYSPDRFRHPLHPSTERPFVEHVMLGYRTFTEGVMTAGRVRGERAGAALRRMLLGGGGGGGSSSSHPQHEQQQQEHQQEEQHPHRRDLLWSFVGFLKADRVAMVESLRTIVRRRSDYGAIKYMWGANHRQSKVKAAGAEGSSEALASSADSKEGKMEALLAAHFAQYSIGYHRPNAASVAAAAAAAAAANTNTDGQSSSSSSSSSSPSPPPLFIYNRSVFEHDCCHGGGLERLYGRSLFVPVGKGFETLDCFRIYEAAAAGAIPVIVGSPEELVATFGGFAVGTMTTSGGDARTSTDTSAASAAARDAFSANMRRGDWRWQRFGFESALFAEEEGDGRNGNENGEGKGEASPSTRRSGGSKKKAIAALSFLDGLPPFVYAESWPMAAAVVKAIVGMGVGDADDQGEEGPYNNGGGNNGDDSATTTPTISTSPPRRDSSIVIDAIQGRVVRWFMQSYRHTQDRLVFGREVVG